MNLWLWRPKVRRSATTPWNVDFVFFNRLESMDERCVESLSVDGDLHGSLIPWRWVFRPEFLCGKSPVQERLRVVFSCRHNGHWRIVSARENWDVYAPVSSGSVAGSGLHLNRTRKMRNKETKNRMTDPGSMKSRSRSTPCLSAERMAGIPQTRRK